VSYYALILVCYLGIDTIAAWGLNLEYGVAGVANLGYILFIAAGAYSYAVLRLPRGLDLGTGASYIGGLHWPGWLAILGSVVVGALLGALLGLVAVRRVRLDYFALVMFGFAILSWTLVGAVPGFLGGQSGLFFIDDPGVSRTSWAYAVLVGIICVACWFVLRRFTCGPVGRTLRAIRDAPAAAASLGKNLFGWRIVVQAVGGAFAALSGALLCGFLGAWSPPAWTSLETLLYLTAVIVGGLGSDVGVLIGVAIVPVLIVQGVQFLPTISSFPQFTSDGTMILFSLTTLGFLFFRPQGVLPSRRPRMRISTSPHGSLGEHAPQVATGRVTARPRSRGPKLLGQAGSDDAVLRAEDVTVRYGGVVAVDHVTFQARLGTITGLIGPNGAGKSTLMNVLRGTQSPDEGRVVLDGDDISAVPTYRRARRGLVASSQLSEPFSRLTVIENLCVAAPAQRAERLSGIVTGRRLWRNQEQVIIERAASLLEEFRLTSKANDLASTLSGGERKMLDVMRTLMTNPRVLLLDEPMAGVTPALCDRIERAMLKLANQGVAIVVVEHDLASIERICDHVVVMASGRVIDTGKMDVLRSSEVVQQAYLNG